VESIQAVDGIQMASRVQAKVLLYVSYVSGCWLLVSRVYTASDIGKTSVAEGPVSCDRLRSIHSKPAELRSSVTGETANISANGYVHDSVDVDAG
jgi:hypothetical protein